MGTTTFTGPVKAGNVLNSDGTGNLAGVGGDSGTANVGFVQMAQSEVVTQAGPDDDGVYVTNIVIPAQSQILGIYLYATDAWTGAAATVGVGNTVSATAYTAAGDITASSVALYAADPGATQIPNWVNVGNTDVQIKLTSTNTGDGVGVLTVLYIQSINNVV